MWVSILKDRVSSYKSAFECDPVSAFGGIVSCNFKINKSLAVELNKTFLEVIIANGFETSALKLLKSKKNVRIIDSTNFDFDDVLQINSASDSMLIQSQDDLVFKKKDFKVVSKKKPNKILYHSLMKSLINYQRYQILCQTIRIRMVCLMKALLNIQ